MMTMIANALSRLPVWDPKDPPPRDTPLLWVFVGDGDPVAYPPGWYLAAAQNWDISDDNRDTHPHLVLVLYPWSAGLMWVPSRLVTGIGLATEAPQTK